MCVPCLLCVSFPSRSVYNSFCVYFHVCFVGPLHTGPKSRSRRILFLSPAIKTIYGNGAVSRAKKNFIIFGPSSPRGLYQHNCSSSFIDTFFFILFFILCSLLNGEENRPLRNGKVKEDEVVKEKCSYAAVIS